jgi:putative MATE family efflux protein
MPCGENTILKGKIFEPLIKFAFPLMLSILLQALYGAVDLIVVGYFGNTSSVSAVSNGSQIMQTVNEVITGLTMGVTVLVGQFVGARDEEKAADTIGGMIKLFTAAAILLTVLMVVFTDKIAVVMQIPPEAMPKAVAYIRICSAGLIFTVAFNAISGLFRGLGNSKSPLLFIAIACGVNIVGDVLLCGVFKLDAAGAAIATVFAQAVSVAFSVNQIRKGKLPFKFGRKNLINTKGLSLRILKIGGPVAVQDFLVSISFLIIISIVNTFGIDAEARLVSSASIGISEKLFLFLALVPVSFMYALSAFVAQNVGAKQEKRALKAMEVAMAVSLGFGFAMAILTYFGGNILAGFFDQNPVVIAATHSYMRGSCAEYIMLPFVFCFLGYFNGIGKTNFVLAEGIISSFAFRIPLCYFLSRLPNATLFTIGLSVPLSGISSLLMCLGYFIFIRRRRLLLHEI